MKITITSLNVLTKEEVEVLHRVARVCGVKKTDNPKEKDDLR